MRILNFAKRNFKEIIRDPLSIVFAILLPLFLLFIFKQINIPSENYELKNFTSGIIVFGFSFITLFTAMLISKDRTSSLLVRLGISPMKPIEYILGYMLAIIPITLIQNVLFFLLAIVLGVGFSINIILAILVSVTEKAASGISSIIVQLVCFTSSMYFPKEMLGDFFSKVCEFLPFESCVTIIKGIMNNAIDIISLRNIVVFSIYTIIVLALSIMIFKKKMLSDKK